MISNGKNLNRYLYSHVSPSVSHPDGYRETVSFACPAYGGGSFSFKRKGTNNKCNQETEGRLNSSPTYHTSPHYLDQPGVADSAPWSSPPYQRR